MVDITDEVSAFEDASTGPTFKQTLLELLLKENTLVNDFDYDEFYNGCFYRGASLGSGATFEQASTPEQRTAIQNGTFKDMFIGDYWTISNKVFRIADFNYWKYIGDTSFTQNHIVIVQDSSFYDGKMSNTNTTSGAYTGSEIRTDPESALGKTKTYISNLFGSYLGTHKSYLANTVTDGAESAGAWVESSVDLISEIMVYGTNVRKKNNAGSYIATSDKTQLALFRLNPSLIQHKRQYWWLRDVVSDTDFAIITGNGSLSGSNALNPSGVRPAFPVVVPSE